MTLFPDIQKPEMQNLKSKLFLGISKEFGISVAPEKLRFGYRPKAHSQRGFDFEVLVHILSFFNFLRFRIP